MRDFTTNRYKELLEALLYKGFSFSTFQAYLQNPEEKGIILRQDVDRLSKNALNFARIQHEIDVKSTFFFRIVPQSFYPKIIEEIASLGHEIGYHYEDVDLAAKIVSSKKYVVSSEKELTAIALELFEKHLAQFRKYYPVQTICMHGSPLSKFDNKLLWKYYDYKDFGIIGEPYFDVDFSNVLYLTDTGRRWNGGSVSVRDKAEGRRRKAEGIDSFEDWVIIPKPGGLINMTEKGVEFQNRYNFRSTNDIIKAAENGELPDKMMVTFHPQRWTDKAVPWIKELVWQNVKNVAKYFLIKIRK